MVGIGPFVMMCMQHGENMVRALEDVSKDYL